MKPLKLILFILFISCYAHAQDTIIAENFFAKEIVNGKLTGKEFIDYQHTYNLDSNLIFKIHYYKDEARIKDFSYFFYTNNLLHSEEMYTLEEGIKSIKRYMYNDDQNLSGIQYFEFANNSPVLNRVEKYYYANTQLTEIEYFNKQGKPYAKTQITYLPNQTIRTTKYKKNTTANNIKLEQMTENFENGIITGKIIQTTLYDKTSRNFVYEYEVDTITGYIMSETKINDKQELVEIKEYLYRRDGSVKLLQVKDKEGLYLEYIRSEKFRHKLKFDLKDMYELPNLK